jgi:plasmid stability protein
MRTTLTLDDDVAAALERRRRERGTGLKAEVNALLRAGLAASEAPEPDAEPFVLPTFDAGRQLLPWTDWKDALDEEDTERHVGGDA